MALNNRSEIYQKIQTKLIIGFCALFFILPNVLHFKHLYDAEPKKITQKIKSKSALYSVAFTPIFSNTEPNVFFITDSEKRAYFSSVFSFVKKDGENKKNIVIIHCATENVSALKSFFIDYNVTTKPCDVHESELKALFQSGDAITIFVFKSNVFQHKTALRIMERLALKPKVTLTEI